MSRSYCNHHGVTQCICRNRARKIEYAPSATENIVPLRRLAMNRRKTPATLALTAACSIAAPLCWSSNEMAFAQTTHFEVERTASRAAMPSAAAPADAARAPTAGGKGPPAGETKPSRGKKPAAAACCAYDQLCCTRQSDIDRVRKPALRTIDVPFANVPDAVIKEATKDGPPIEGIPDVRVVDGTGAPFPWRDGPKQFEIRIIPLGGMGFLRFGNDFSGTLYDKPEHRSLGYGVTAPITDTPDKGRSLVTGPIEYWTYSRGEGDKLIHDHVKGKLEGSPKIIAERWLHVAAVNAAEGIVHAYRATYDNQPYVFFVLPEVVLGFESKNTKSFGGTGNDRFASDFPYTLYRFPLGAGHSDTINCIIREYEVRRWFERPKDAMKLPEDMAIVISMSQTSAENEPRIRIMFL